MIEIWIDEEDCGSNVKKESVFENGGFTEVEKMTGILLRKKKMSGIEVIDIDDDDDKEDEEDEEEEGEVDQEGRIVKSFLKDFGTWKDDNVVIASLIDLEDCEFVEGMSGNLGEDQCDVKLEFGTTLVPEVVEERKSRKIPRKRMTKIQYLDILVGRSSGFDEDSCGKRKKSSKRMSKRDYLGVLGGCDKPVLQSRDESLSDENSSRGNKFESVVRDRAKELRGGNDENRDLFNKLPKGDVMEDQGMSERSHVTKAFDGNLGKRYPMDDSSNRSLRSNVSQSCSRPAAFSSKADTEVRSSRGEMGMKYMGHSREKISKARLTDKSHRRETVDAQMNASECPLRCGNSKSKPSISRSNSLKRCTEKKYEYQHHTSGAKKHKSQVAVSRAKVQRALRLFRAIFRALFQDNERNCAEQNGTKIRRFDLMSATILKKNNEWVNSGRKIVGTVPGVEVGDEYHYRVELVLIGLHHLYENGIDYVNEDGRILATSVVASGVYADYMYDSDVLVYCGQGGNPQRKMSGGDQKLDRGNLALKNSMNAKSPVRVIRGFKEGKGNETLLARLDMDGHLFYDGLYMVEHYWEEQDHLGNNVFKFRLRRIPGQPTIDWVKKSERVNQQ